MLPWNYTENELGKVYIKLWNCK